MYECNICPTCGDWSEDDGCWECDFHSERLEAITGLLRILRETSDSEEGIPPNGGPSS